MKRFALIFFLALMPSFAHSEELKLNDQAPLFSLKTESGANFDLNTRLGKWTVLYFYPKAGTPGCTKQACAFRDNIEKIRKEGADVFGISADSVEEQAAFHKEHHLTFSLLADPEDRVVNLYGTKMPVLKMSKRWTFILDPQLKIRKIIKGADPVLDSEKTAKEIAELKKM